MLIFCLLIVSLIHGSSQFHCIPPLLEPFSRIAYPQSVLDKFCCYDDVDWKRYDRTWIVSWRKTLKELYEGKEVWEACKEICKVRYKCQVQKEISSLEKALEGGLTNFVEGRAVENYTFFVMNADFVDKNKVTKENGERFLKKFIDQSVMYRIPERSYRAVKEESNPGKIRVCPVLKDAAWFGCDFIRVENWKENNGTTTYLYACVFNYGRKDRNRCWDEEK